MKAHSDLVEAAMKAKTNAYAPYSVYSVGAAVLADDGRIFAGCNVENASYGLTVCAERNAVAAMIFAGGDNIIAVAVVTKDGARPCGACLQVLAEFAASDGVDVLCVDQGGKTESLKLTDLLPHAFNLKK